MSKDETVRPKLTAAQLTLLKQYGHTSDGEFMQHLPGATQLWKPLGLLDWRGESFGCHFYSITDAGRKALSDHSQT